MTTTTITAATSPPSSPDIFADCSDACGWTAGIVALLCYGMYGIPIKQSEKNVQNVHPFILQSYKTITMFVCSLLVLLLGVSLKFTSWGILSGLLWVLGGSGGILAIQNVGMSVAVGIWSSVMVMSNFVWGIIIFREPVANIYNTLLAFIILATGLVGMSLFGHATSPTSNTLLRTDHTTNRELKDNILESSLSSSLRIRPLQRSTSGESGILLLRRSRSGDMVALNDDDSVDDQDKDNDDNNCRRDTEDSDWERERDILQGPSSVSIRRHQWMGSKRTIGFAAAIFNGFLTGSSLIPIHYAPYRGAEYMFSFATGALVSNICLWMIWYAYWVWKLSNARSALQQLPAWRCRELYLPGIAAYVSNHLLSMFASLLVSSRTYSFCSSMMETILFLFSACCRGLLLTMAMFGSMLSVTYLGQGVGNSIVQAKILVRYVSTRCVCLDAHLLLRDSS
jgi:hypothetical protein